jgi:hypothetical protein
MIENLGGIMSISIHKIKMKNRIIGIIILACLFLALAIGLFLFLYFTTRNIIYSSSTVSLSYAIAFVLSAIAAIATHYLEKGDEKH